MDGDAERLEVDPVAPEAGRHEVDPAAPDPKRREVERREVVKWLWRLPVIAVLGGAGYGLYEAINVHFLKRRPSAQPDFTPAEATTVAPLSRFAADWDAVEFVLAGSLPALALRLPGPIAGGLEVGEVSLAAFSRICTHQHCLTNLNTDVAAINFGFNYGTQTPAITCPCHLSVFDPLRAGRAVSGPAVQPLPRVRLELDGDIVVATGFEET